MDQLPKSIVRITCFIVIVLVAACQPITHPAAGTLGTACSDQEKRDLLTAYIAAYAEQDPAAAVALFLPDGQLSVEVGPRPDGATGNYKVPFVGEFVGHDEILNIVQVFIDDINLGITIDPPTVQGDTVMANGKVSSIAFLSLATPVKEIAGNFTAEVRDCKLAQVRWAYSEEASAALPEAARLQASQCSDEWKVAVFEQYIDGVNSADAELALIPWAENADMRFDGPPRFVESTQEYIVDPSIERHFQGMDAIKTTIDYLISIELATELDLTTVQIDGQTMTLVSTVSTPAFIGEPWLLPLDKLGDVYTVTFDDQCKLAAVDHAYPHTTLQQLKEAKLAQ